ncbi:hypothetical protein WN944_004403 [Citrus x changshan-huyou]|uniref:Uncharacterized protein n=1 Tax=Citrus x changshan-huyou TaxID=2935761 RepID=A0AAP0M1D7_9ROSI
MDGGCAIVRPKSPSTSNIISLLSTRIALFNSLYSMKYYLALLAQNLRRVAYLEFELLPRICSHFRSAHQEQEGRNSELCPRAHCGPPRLYVINGDNACLAKITGKMKPED